MSLLVFALSLLLFADSGASLSASPDKVLRHAESFRKPVPKIVHQIWFGDKNRKNSCHAEYKDNTLQEWSDYCEQLGWEYKLWTEENDAHIKTFVSPENMRLLEELRQERNYYSASDVLRYEVLRHYGGVYADCDFHPPTRNGKYIDIFDIFPSKGLSFALENFLQNIGNGSVFVGNYFIMSPKDDSLIPELCDKVAKSCSSVRERIDASAAAGYTGPQFVNRLLSGCFNAFSTLYPEEHNMLRPQTSNPSNPNLIAHSPPTDDVWEKETDPELPASSEKGKYFEAPVPRIIHQVWLGPAPHPHVFTETQQKWKAYCEQHGYTYMLWTENSPGAKEMLSPDNLSFFSLLLREWRFEEASDLLRYAVLLEHGGFYVGHDIFPPTIGDTSLAMEKVFPCKGLVMLIHPICMNPNTHTALYVSTCILFSAKGHPIMQKAVSTIVDNFQAYASTGTHMDGTYITGDHFLSRILTGCYVLVHPKYLRTQNMTRDPN